MEIIYKLCCFVFQHGRKSHFPEKCQHCDKIISHLNQARAMHMKYVHPDIQKPLTKPGWSNYTPPTECKICDIQFDSYYHYQVHYAKKVRPWPFLPVQLYLEYTFVLHLKKEILRT